MWTKASVATGQAAARRSKPDATALRNWFDRVTPLTTPHLGGATPVEGGPGGTCPFRAGLAPLWPASQRLPGSPLPGGAGSGPTFCLFARTG